MFPELKNPTHIVMHCSASRYGDAELIKSWHVEGRKWSRLGYHYVILNGQRNSSKRIHYKNSDNGLVEAGTEVWYQGIHCPSMNDKALAICLIGERHFTIQQFQAALDLVTDLSLRYTIPSTCIIGHNETPKQQSILIEHRKTCPTFDMDVFRHMLTAMLERKMS